MRKLGQFVVNFVKAEDGPTAVEYAVMLALIIVVCIGAITTLGGNANGTRLAPAGRQCSDLFCSPRQYPPSRSLITRSCRRLRRRVSKERSGPCTGSDHLNEVTDVRGND